MHANPVPTNLLLPRRHAAGVAARQAARVRQRRAPFAAGAAALVAAASIGTAALASEPLRSMLADMPIEKLKRTYLACNHAALGGHLATLSVMQCSMVYEVLKERAFDGDFEKLLDWSRTQASLPPEEEI